MAGKRRPRSAVHSQITRNAHKDGTYENLYAKQGGVCGICKKPQPENITRKFDVDHDHKTLKIRGLLHRGCNMRLRRGLSPEWLRAAAEYLEKNS